MSDGQIEEERERERVRGRKLGVSSCRLSAVASSSSHLRVYFAAFKLGPTPFPLTLILALHEVLPDQLPLI